MNRISLAGMVIVLVATAIHTRAECFECGKPECHCSALPVGQMTWQYSKGLIGPPRWKTTISAPGFLQSIEMGLLWKKEDLTLRTPFFSSYESRISLLGIPLFKEKAQCGSVNFFHCPAVLTPFGPYQPAPPACASCR